MFHYILQPHGLTMLTRRKIETFSHPLMTHLPYELRALFIYKFSFRK